MEYVHEDISYYKNCDCINTDPFINKYSDYKPYCRWCGEDFITNNKIN